MRLIHHPTKLRGVEESYSVTFNVQYDGSNVANISVMLDGYTKVTDVSGNAVFYNVKPQNNVPYEIDGGYDYEDQSGTVDVVSADVNVNIELVFDLSDRISLFTSTTGRGGYSNVYSATRILDNDDHHLLMVKNGTNVKIYIDGVLDKEETIDSATIFDSNAIVYIGAVERSNVVVDRKFNGLIDLCRYWKKAVSPAEYNSLWNSGVGLDYSGLSGSLLTDLVSSWEFSGDLTDAKGFIDGTAAGSISYGVDRNGNANQAVVLNDAAVKIADNSEYEYEDFSVECWFKRLGNAFASGVAGTLMSKYHSSYRRQWIVEIRDSA